MSDRAVTLVLTDPFDPTADYVVTELNERLAPLFRCDPGEFPTRLALTARLEAGHWKGWLRRPERCVRLEDIAAVYYRRPSAFEFPDAMSEEMRSFASREARMGLGGVLACLPGWLNHPGGATVWADYKPVQLATVQTCGLTVPATMITNEPAAARAFVTEVGKAIYKPFTQGSVGVGDSTRVVFATPVSATDIDESISLTAHLLQARVSKQYEVRLTVVDGRFFAARLDAGSEAARIDWRRDYDSLSYAVIPELPADVCAGVRRLMRSFGLRFAAMDFIVDSTGAHHFLDLNPNGQWAWIEDVTGLPITAALADALTSGANL